MDLEINMTIQQQPVIAKRIHIKVTTITFNESAKFDVDFYKSNEPYDMDLIKTETVLIEGDEYKEWKDDDDYIINLICKKLGINQA